MMHGPTNIKYDSDICNYGSELQFLTNTTVKQSGSLPTIMTNPQPEVIFIHLAMGRFIPVRHLPNKTLISS